MTCWTCFIRASVCFVKKCSWRKSDSSACTACATSHEHTIIGAMTILFFHSLPVSPRCNICFRLQQCVCSRSSSSAETTEERLQSGGMDCTRPGDSISLSRRYPNTCSCSRYRDTNAQVGLRTAYECGRSLLSFPAGTVGKQARVACRRCSHYGRYTAFVYRLPDANTPYQHQRIYAGFCVIIENCPFRNQWLRGGQSFRMLCFIDL